MVSAVKSGAVSLISGMRAVSGAIVVLIFALLKFRVLLLQVNRFDPAGLVAAVIVISDNVALSTGAKFSDWLSCGFWKYGGRV